MVRSFKTLALAGAMMTVAVPAFAQGLPGLNSLGIDLDPFHIFTPAPAVAPAPAPMAATIPKSSRSAAGVSGKRSSYDSTETGMPATRPVITPMTMMLAALRHTSWMSEQPRKRKS